MAVLRRPSSPLAQRRGARGGATAARTQESNSAQFIACGVPGEEAPNAALHTHAPRARMRWAG